MVYSYSGITDALGALSAALTGVSLSKINFRITVPQPSGGVVFDNWGNPVSANTGTAIALQCSVRPAKDPSADGNPGVNRSQIYLEGRLHSPTDFTLPIPRGCSAEYLDDGRWRSGKFYPLDALNQPMTESIDSDRAFGRSISGYFEILEGD